MRSEFFAAAALALAASPALAEGGMTSKEVAAILENESMTVAIEGEGTLSASAWGFTFEIYGYHCEGERCTEYLFVTGFDLPNGFPLERINDWNAGEPAGRAFLDDDGDPFLDHSISVSGPGDAGAFREGLFLWLNALDSFSDFIDQQAASA